MTYIFYKDCGLLHHFVEEFDEDSICPSSGELYSNYTPEEMDKFELVDIEEIVQKPQAMIYLIKEYRNELIEGLEILKERQRHVEKL